MSCQCEIYEICAQCAPSQEAFLKAVRDHDEVVNRHQPKSPSPSYTLAELNELAKRWADENEATNDARWIVSGLLAWLGKKEREGNDAKEANTR